ncbi:alkaline phosphatase D family protein [soil metagenome]
MTKVLAGPLLRRAEQGRVIVWVATDSSARISGHVYTVSPGEGARDRLGGGEAETVRIGRRLFVHLLHLVPDGKPFPTDAWLAYDLELTSEGGEAKTLADLGLLAGEHSLVYAGFELPSFFLREKTSSLAMIHGSCRMLHGRGEDALALADEQTARNASDMSVRPSAVLLTGDQLYADDVAGPIVHHLGDVGKDVVGDWVNDSIAGLPSLDSIPLYGRLPLITERFGFTSDHGDNHLLSFGEFATLYLLNWNEDNWPDDFPELAESDLPDVGPRKKAEYKRYYARQVKELETVRASVRGVRRLLANVPTYMIFDDHDVTDDWNLTREWQRRIYEHPGARRVIANALAGYWAFQGWGNDPDAFDDDFKRAISAHLAEGNMDAGADYDAQLWSFNRWCFVAPTEPKTLFLDTRTERSFDEESGPARLISQDGLGRARATLTASGYEPGHRLNVVSAVPVYGFEARQQRHKLLVDLVGPYRIDLEAWRSNPQGFIDFLTFMTDEVRPSHCVFLSGDVHYAYNVRAEFSTAENRLQALQFTSSPQKNTGNGVRAGIGVIGRIVSKQEEHLVWDRPPRATSRNPVRRLQLRFATMGGDGPVFLTPKVADDLGIDQPPDYKEKRVYVRPTGPTSSLIVACNNIGYVLQRHGRMVHRLLTHSRGRTTTFTASMPVEDPNDPGE